MSYLNYGGYFGGLTTAWVKMPLKKMIQNFMIFKKTFSFVKKTLFCKYTANNFETLSEKKNCLKLQIIVLIEVPLTALKNKT